MQSPLWTAMYRMVSSSLRMPLRRPTSHSKPSLPPSGRLLIRDLQTTRPLLSLSTHPLAILTAPLAISWLKSRQLSVIRLLFSRTNLLLSMQASRQVSPALLPPSISSRLLLMHLPVLPQPNLRLSRMLSMHRLHHSKPSLVSSR